MAFAACRRRAPSLLGSAAVSWCSSLSPALGQRAPSLLDGAAVYVPCRSLSHAPFRGSRRSREEKWRWWLTVSQLRCAAGLVGFASLVHPWVLDRLYSGTESPPPGPFLAGNFAELTTAILKRTDDEGTIDKMYDEFMQDAKKKLIRDLKDTYNDLYKFYTDPSKTTTPSWLFNSPPAKGFYTNDVDMQLLGKKSQIEQDLRAFLEELGFVCSEVSFCNSFFEVRLRLDVTTVPTTEAHKDVKGKLLTLERVS